MRVYNRRMPGQPHPPTRQWRSSLREMVLIVASILIAFFLDAWWDERIEARALDEALQAVRNDLLATGEELQRVEGFNQRYLDGVAQLLALDTGALDALAPATANTLAELLTTGGLTFDPTLGALDAMIASGQLHRVGDVGLRSAIAAWPGLLDELEEDHAILIEMYMAQQERLVQLGLYLQLMPGDLDGDRTRAAREALAEAIADVELRNRLAAHAVAIRGLLDELRLVGRHLEHIVGLLDSAGAQ